MFVRKVFLRRPVCFLTCCLHPRVVHLDIFALHCIGLFVRNFPIFDEGVAKSTLLNREREPKFYLESTYLVFVRAYVLVRHARDHGHTL